MDNQNGGWDIGGEKYKIELCIYDSNNSQTSEVAAVNKMIFQDKVSYIMGQGVYGAAWLPITEENKVIAMSPTHNYFVALDPKFNYSFEPTCVNGTSSTMIGWICTRHPELAKTIVVAFPDNQMGHMIAGDVQAGWKAFNATINCIYYPTDTQDLSSLGTKVATTNPSVFEAVGGGNSDLLAIKAAYQAGYRGQMFASTINPATVMAQTVPEEALNGMICGAYPTEFEPALTQKAIDFKAGWIAKYGKWEDPDIAITSSYDCLKTAIQKTGSLDTTVLAAAIGNGLQFETAVGTIQMVSRPDFGNSRTVDSLAISYVKKMNGTQPELLDTVNLEDGLKYWELSFPAKQ